MRQKLVSLLIKAYQKKSFYLITADIGFNLLEPLQKIMQDDFINVGIAENSMLSMAAGLASPAKKVVVITIASFLAIKSLINIKMDIAYHQSNVLMIALGSNYYYGRQGYSHYAVEDMSILLPWAVDIFDPATEEELLFSFQSIFASIQPAYLRIDRTLFLEKGEMIYAGIFKRGKGDLALLTSGSISVGLEDKFTIYSCCQIRNVSLLSTIDPFIIFEEAITPSPLATLLANQSNALLSQRIAVINNRDTHRVATQEEFRGDLIDRLNKFCQERELLLG